MSCVFCSIIEKNDPHHEVVWESDAYLAFLTKRPEQPGHVLVIPKAHVDYIFDLSPESYAGLMEASRRLSIPLKEARKVKRITLGVSGFDVPHVHVHLVPANDHNALCMPLDSDWSEKPEVLEEIGDELRTAFKKA